MDVDNVERMVFSGGGLRGIAYLGALLAIRDRTQKEPCTLAKQFAGCSIGSLVACLLVLQFSVSEIHEFLHSLDLGCVFGVSYESMLTTFAMNDGSSLVKLVSDALSVKQIPLHATFADLQKLYPAKLHVGVSDLTDATFVLASADTTPTMPVVHALVASMSLPPLFKPQRWNGHLYTDGGIMDGFPIRKFPKAGTLGFKISWYIDPSPMDSILSYYTRVLACIQMHHEQDTNFDKDYSIFHIDVGNFSAFHVDASRIAEQVVYLVLNGYRQVNVQLDKPITDYPNPRKFLHNG